jgi:hypothetical protein
MCGTQIWQGKEKEKVILCMFFDKKKMLITFIVLRKAILNFVCENYLHAPPPFLT